MTYLSNPPTLNSMQYRTIYTMSISINMALIKHALTLGGIPFHITNESLLHSSDVVVRGNSTTEIMVYTEDEKAVLKLL